MVLAEKLSERNAMFMRDFNSSLKDGEIQKTKGKGHCVQRMVHVELSAKRLDLVVKEDRPNDH